MSCDITNCSKPLHGKKYCFFHYQRLRQGIELSKPLRRLHHKSHSREYTSWSAMKTRCLNVNHQQYSSYGGRGIKICNKWLDSFLSFYEDMGDRPPNTTLDRIDNESDYEPSNCKWSTPGEQALNTRRTILGDTSKEQRIKHLLDSGLDKATVQYAMNIKL